MKHYKFDEILGLILGFIFLMTIGQFIVPDMGIYDLGKLIIMNYLEWKVFVWGMSMIGWQGYSNSLSVSHFFSTSYNSPKLFIVFVFTATLCDI